MTDKERIKALEQRCTALEIVAMALIADVTPTGKMTLESLAKNAADLGLLHALSDEYLEGVHQRLQLLVHGR